jgi:hypothetical protein
VDSAGRFLVERGHIDVFEADDRSTKLSLDGIKRIALSSSDACESYAVLRTLWANSFAAALQSPRRLTARPFSKRTPPFTVDLNKSHPHPPAVRLTPQALKFDPANGGAYGRCGGGVPPAAATPLPRGRPPLHRRRQGTYPPLLTLRCKRPDRFDVPSGVVRGWA